MQFIASGKAQALIVADLSRITRSHSDLLQFIDRFRFLDGERALISVREKLDTRTPEGRAMLGMMHTLAGLDGADLREPWGRNVTTPKQVRAVGYVRVSTDVQVSGA